MFLDGIYSPLIYLFIVLLMIFCTYFGTKWISKRYLKMFTGQNIKVIERTALGQDKSLVLVKAAKKVYLLGVTGREVSTIGVFEEDEFDLSQPCNSQKPDFSSVISEIMKKQFTFGKSGKNENFDAGEKKQ